jgi:hypothetical protein
MRFAIITAVAALLLACAPPPPAANFPEIAFRDSPPFRVDVAEVALIESYLPPLRAPHVEHESPMPPVVPMRNWVRDRLIADGADGSLKATVVDAHITETLLSVNEDLAANLTTEQGVRFDGRVEMRLEILDRAGSVRASVNGEATRSRTMPEDATLREREEVLFQMAEDLANDLNTELEANIRQHFAPYLR